MDDRIIWDSINWTIDEKNIRADIKLTSIGRMLTGIECKRPVELDDLQLIEIKKTGLYKNMLLMMIEDATKELKQIEQAGG